MLGFNPRVVQIDYSASLRKALLAKNLFENTPLIIHYFFHYGKTIIKHMKLYGLIKGKITKYSFEIIKNIEFNLVYTSKFYKIQYKICEKYLLLIFF